MEFENYKSNKIGLMNELIAHLKKIEERGIMSDTRNITCIVKKIMNYDTQVNKRSHIDCWKIFVVIYKIKVARSRFDR